MMLNEVQGQEEGVRYLRRFIEGKLTMPLLLVGDEGVGRRFSVVQAIRELFCVGSKTKECRCLNCYHINNGSHPDFVAVASSDEKDIGVDTIRDVIGTTTDYPSMAPLKCFVIDGADHMTVPAANALLKTLEEPPSTSRFFLLAEDYKSVLPTIRSRCGKVLYHSLPEAVVHAAVQRYEPDAGKALVISKLSGGSIGRAIRYWGSGLLSLRDRMFSLLQQAARADLPAVFSIVDDLAKNLSLGLRFLEYLICDILMLPCDPSRVINQDLREALEGCRSSIPMGAWTKFSSGVANLRSLERSVSVNLSFHVKSLFASTFAGV